MNSTRSPQTERLRRLAVYSAALLVFGGFYAFLAGNGIAIPCPFYTLTGLQCPGCGVTRMALCLLRGDFFGAFQQNAAIFCLLPAGAVLVVSRCICYVRQGSHRLRRWETVMVWCMIAVLLVYGAGRNAAAFL